MRVEGHSHLIKRDGAVINTDRNAYERAKKRKAEKARIESLETRLERIERLLEKIVNG